VVIIKTKVNLVIIKEIIPHPIKAVIIKVKARLVLLVKVNLLLVAKEGPPLVLPHLRAPRLQQQLAGVGAEGVSMLHLEVEAEADLAIVDEEQAGLAQIADEGEAILTQHLVAAEAMELLVEDEVELVVIDHETETAAIANEDPSDEAEVGHEIAGIAVVGIEKEAAEIERGSRAAEIGTGSQVVRAEVVRAVVTSSDV